jgi:cell wall assembly regulator SMI1
MYYKVHHRQLTTPETGVPPSRLGYSVVRPGGEPLRRVASSWKIIEGVLKENAHTAYKGLRRSASSTAIDKFESTIDKNLPRALVSSLLIHDGIADGVAFVNYMTLLPLSRIRSWWRVQCRVQRMGEFGGNPYVQTSKIKNDVRWRPGWIPVMADAGGDLLVVDLDPASAGTRGQLFPWFNNCEGKMRVVAKSFAEWLDAVAAELQHRRFTLDKFGGIQLRKRLA